MTGLSSVDLEQYGDRKKLGRVSLLVDTLNEKIHFVSREMEHIDFIHGLESDSGQYHRYVPVHVDVNDGMITKMLTGISGVELELKVRHSPKELREAHRLAREFIERGNVPYAPRCLHKIDGLEKY